MQALRLARDIKRAVRTRTCEPPTRARAGERATRNVDVPRTHTHTHENTHRHANTRRGEDIPIYLRVLR